MSQLQNYVSAKCIRCGAVLIIKSVVVYEADPDGTKLMALTKSVIETAMCNYCSNQVAYRAGQEIYLAR